MKAIGAHDAEALAIIRHSSAHVMADAVQRLFPGTKVAFGPATQDGFYYDYARPDGTFSEEDLRAIEEKMAEIIEADSPFRREVVTRDEARRILPKRSVVSGQQNSSCNPLARTARAKGASGTLGKGSAVRYLRGSLLFRENGQKI